MRRNVKRRLSPTGFGLLALVLAAVATYLGFTKAIPFRHHYEVHAVMSSSPPLRKGSLVRIAGVNVGKVTGFEGIPGPQPASRITMQVSDRGLPLHADAKLKVRPQLLFEGNFFVDLSPGSPSAPVMRDGGTIPVNNTAAPVQLDQVLGALESDTRGDLKRVLRELDVAYSHGGATGYRRSIRWWEPAYRDSSLVSDATLGILDGDLSGYLKGSTRVADALDRNAIQLKSLITDLRVTAGAFAARDRSLSSAIHELPRTLRVGRPALAALNRALPPVRRFVADARPGVRSTPAALDAQLPFVRQLRGLVRPAELQGLSADLRATVPGLADFNRTTVPLLGVLRENASCQNQVLLPWGEDRVGDPDFPATGRVYEEGTKPLVGLAGESRSGDANGQWFRVSLTAGVYAFPAGSDRFLLTDQPPVGYNPAPPKQRPPLRADVPCETQRPPDLRSTPQTMPTSGIQVTVPQTKAAQKEQQDAFEAARKAVERDFRRTGADVKVSDQLLTRPEIPRIDFGLRSTR